LPEVITTRGKGRPKVEFNDTEIRMIYRMARRGLPIVVIAGIVGCSKRTLERRMSEDPEIFDAISKGKSEAYDEIFKTAYEMAQQGNERFLLYFIEKFQSDAEYEHNLGSKEVGDDKNVTEGVNRERLLNALKKDKFLSIEGSEDGDAADKGNNKNEPR
jgi:hypothetical protein